MKDFLLRIFTWWNGATLGTRFYTRRFGGFVGEDAFGNRYYRYVQKEAIDPSVGAERRWVIYNGAADPSRVPPGWRGWLTHNFELPPTEDPYRPHEWEKPHVANMTGTAHAYRPRGSQLSTGERPAATGDYVPWTPGGLETRSPLQSAPSDAGISHVGLHGKPASPLAQASADLERLRSLEKNQRFS